MAHASFIRLSACSLALVAVAVAFAWASTGGGRAQAGGDLSGTWEATYWLTCDATFVQTDTTVTGGVDCGGDLTVELAGAVEGGAFTLTGAFGLVPLDVTGTLDAGGDGLTGTFSFPPVVQQGSFTGERVGAGEGLTGDWIITVADIFAGGCSVDIAQTGSDLEADAECADQPLGTLTGTYDQATGEIVLSGPFGTFTGIEVAATLAEDGRSFSGTWAVTPDEAGGPTGVIEGSRLSGPPDGGDPGDGIDDVDDETAPTVAPAVLPESGGGAGGSGSHAFALAGAAAALAASTVLLAAARRLRS